MRFILLFCFLLISGITLPETGFAQDEPKEKEFVLVATFAPAMYVCNGEHLICKSSDINPNELNNVFRRSTEATLIRGLSDHFNVKSLETNSSAYEYGDLTIFYQITGYQHKTKKRLKAYYKGYPSFKLGKIIGPRRVRWGSDCVNGTASRPNSRKHNYEQVKINNDSLYKEIVSRNKGAFVVYISNFEMNTRYKSCLDLYSNVFQRDLYLHYNLLDKEGKLVDGGVVGTTFQSSSNNLDIILDKNLGILCGYIIDIARNKL